MGVVEHLADWDELPQLVPLKRVAEMLKVETPALRRRIERGKFLRPILIPGAQERQYPKAELREWLEANLDAQIPGMTPSEGPLRKSA